MSFAAAPSMPFGMGTPFSWESVLGSSYIDKNTQAQLSKVYLALAATLASACAGSLSFIKWRIFSDPSTPSILALLLMLALTFTKPTKSNTGLRLGMLLTFGFLDGCALGPIVHATLRIDPSILVSALVSATLAFVCFSASALTAKRRSMLYLGGILSTTVSFLALASFFSFFFRSSMFSWVNLYMGLFVFCGFIVFDTQLMVEQIISGNKDFVVMALNLFVDFVAIFVRILVILLNSAEKKDEDNGRRSRR